MSPVDFSALDRVGLTLHAVFDLDALPADLLARLREDFDPQHRFCQLILVGNAGRALWDAIGATGPAAADPIDEFSAASVEHWFSERFAGCARRIIYPGPGFVDLQALGRLAGWHHDSPLMLGVLPEWGSWFAYRVAMMTAGELTPSKPLSSASPCASCVSKACIAACPAGAMASGRLALEACVDFRRRPGSPCAATCLARLSCPVGADHRYSEEQMRHSYAHSLRAIERHWPNPPAIARARCA